VKGFSQRCP